MTDEFNKLAAAKAISIMFGFVAIVCAIALGLLLAPKVMMWIGFGTACAIVGFFVFRIIRVIALDIFDCLYRACGGQGRPGGRCGRNFDRFVSAWDY